MNRFLLPIGLFLSLFLLPLLSAAPSTRLLSPSLLPGESTELLLLARDTDRAFLGELPKSTQFTLSLKKTTTPKNASGGRDTLFRLELRALSEGSLEIPPIPVDIQGTTQLSAPIQVQVLSPARLSWHQAHSQGTEITYASRWSVARDQLYPGQATEVFLHLYLPEFSAPPQLSFPRDNSSGIALTPLLPTDQVKYKDSPAGHTYLRGRSYHSFVFTAKATALSEGELSLGPAKAQALFPIRQRVGIQEQERKIAAELAIPALTLKGLPFPDTPPPSFRGAIGHFQLEASLPKLRLQAGAPVELELEVTGEGNLSELPAPVPELLGDWSVISTQRLRRPASQGVAFQVLLSHPGTPETLPAFVLTSFDPRSQKFTQTRSPAIPALWQGQISAPSASPSAKPSPSAQSPFAPIQERSDSPIYQPSQPPFWWRPKIGLAAIFPLLVLVAMSLRQRHRQQHPKLALIGRLKQIPAQLPDHEFLRQFSKEIELATRPEERALEPIPEILEMRDSYCYSPDKERFVLSAGRRKAWIKALAKCLKCLALLLLFIPGQLQAAPLSADEWTNQGMQFARQARWPEASRAFRIALAADADHEQAQNALTLVNRSAQAQVPEAHPLKDSLGRYAAQDYLSGGAVLALLSLYLLAAAPLTQLHRKKATYTGIACASLSALLLLAWHFYPKAHSRVDLQHLALSTETTQLYHGPSTTAAAQAIPPASLLTIQAERGPWLFVSTPQKKSFWVPQQQLLRFNLDN